MSFDELYHFLFETTAGIGVLVGICLVLSVVLSVILERRTRRLYKDRPKTEDDWSLFDDDDGENASA